jgi:DNA replication protein DnaC
MVLNNLQYSNVGVFPRYINMSYSDFINDKEAVENIKKYAIKSNKVLEQGIGLYLQGKRHCGKTMLINLLAKDLIDQKHSVFIFRDLNAFIKLIDYKLEESIQEAANKIFNYDFLIFDQFLDAYLNTYSYTHLKRIFNERIAKKKPTIFCSHLTPKNFVGNMGKDITDIQSEDFRSLVKLGCIPVSIMGDDFSSIIFNNNIELFKKL